MRNTKKTLKKLFMFGGSTEQNLKFLQALKNIGTFGNSSADEIATAILNNDASIDKNGYFRAIEENFQDILPEFGSPDYQQLVDNGTISTVENFGKMFNNNYFEAFSSLKDWYADLSKTKKLAFDMYGNFVLADRAKIDTKQPTSEELLIKEVNNAIDGAVVAGTALNNSNLAEILRKNKGVWSTAFYNAYKSEFQKRIKAIALAGVTDTKDMVIKDVNPNSNQGEVKKLTSEVVEIKKDALKGVDTSKISKMDMSDQLDTKTPVAQQKQAKKGIFRLLSVIFKNKI